MDVNYISAVGIFRVSVSLTSHFGYKPIQMNNEELKYHYDRLLKDEDLPDL